MLKMTRCARPLSLAALVVMGGCVNYAGIDHRQTLLTPEGAPSASLADARLPAAPWPTENWWQQYADAQLDRLVAKAWASNPGLQEVRARADKANAYQEYYDADRAPQVDAAGGVSRSRLSRSEDFAGQGNRYVSVRSLGVTFDYDLDLWGGKRSAWEASVNQARAAEVELQSARLLLAANVVKAYNQLTYAWDVVDLSERDLKRLRNLQSLTGDRFHNGLDNKSQLQRVDGLVARAEASLLGARSDVEIARLQLSALLGAGVDGARDIVRPKPLKSTEAALPESLPAELLGRRPDIVAARWRVEAESRTVASVKTRFYPNINLRAAGGIHAMSGDSFNDTVSRFWNITPTVTVPLFDAGRLRADLKQSNADLDLAIARYNATLNTALHQVATSVTELQAVNRQIGLQRTARDTAQSSFDLAVERFEVGENNFLDSLNIEEQLIEDELRLALLSSKQIDSAVGLVTALGGGYQPESVNVQ